MHALTPDQLTWVLQQLPSSLKTSFENPVTQQEQWAKYHHDWVLAMPKGIPCVVLFTTNPETQQPLAVVLENANSRQCQHVENAWCITSLPYSPLWAELTDGRHILVHGVLVSGRAVVVVHDVLVWGGQIVHGKPWSHKLAMLHTLFVSGGLDVVGHLFALPVYATSDAALSAAMAQRPPCYPVHSIVGRKWSTFSMHVSCTPLVFQSFRFNAQPLPEVRFQETNGWTFAGTKSTTVAQWQFVVLWVRADLADDVYVASTSDGVDVGRLAIQTAEWSEFMNRLYRYVKENARLDAVLESDDEASFEDPRPAKHVDLDKRLAFKCLYHKQFNKWTPIDVCRTHMPVSTYQQACAFQQNVIRPSPSSSSSSYKPR